MAVYPYRLGELFDMVQSDPEFFTRDHVTPAMLTVIICDAFLVYPGKGRTIDSIQNGDCEWFADAVLMKLALFGRAHQVQKVESRNFMVPHVTGKDDAWDVELLTQTWNAPAHLFDDKIIAALAEHGREHVWLTDGAKHYDVEVPDGVDHMFDLPFYKRHYERLSRSHSIA